MNRNLLAVLMGLALATSLSVALSSPNRTRNARTVSADAAALPAGCPTQAEPGCCPGKTGHDPIDDFDTRSAKPAAPAADPAKP